eukprot:6206464-Pleurochrysis_carterae.AAC.2
MAMTASKTRGVEWSIFYSNFLVGVICKISGNNPVGNVSAQKTSRVIGMSTIAPTRFASNLHCCTFDTESGISPTLTHPPPPGVTGRGCSSGLLDV